MHTHSDHFYWARKASVPPYGPGSQWLWAGLWCPLDHAFCRYRLKSVILSGIMCSFFPVTIYLHGSPSTGRSWTVAECNKNCYKNQSQNNLSCRTVVKVEYDHLQKRSCFTKWTKGNTVLLLGPNSCSQGHTLAYSYLMGPAGENPVSSDWLGSGELGLSSLHFLPAGCLGEQQCDWKWLSNFWASATWLRGLSGWENNHPSWNKEGQKKRCRLPSVYKSLFWRILGGSETCNRDVKSH